MDANGYMTILLVEDNEQDSLQLRNYFAHNKEFRIVGYTGSEKVALDMVQQFNPDFVILDLELRNDEGSGLGFLSNLPKDGPRPGFILVTTKYESKKTQNYAISMGANFVFEKGEDHYGPAKIENLFLSMKDFLPSASVSASVPAVNSTPYHLGGADLRTEIRGDLKVMHMPDLRGSMPLVEAIARNIESNCRIHSFGKIYSQIAKEFEIGITGKSLGQDINTVVTRIWDECSKNESLIFQMLGVRYENYETGMSGVEFIKAFSVKFVERHKIKE